VALSAGQLNHLRDLFSQWRREYVRDMTRRNLHFALAMIVSVGLYWIPLRTLMSSSVHSDAYAYMAVIPLMSACLIYLERKTIFCDAQYGFGSGAAVLLFALTLLWWSKRHSGWLSPDDSLSLITLSVVVLWMGFFVLCYGTKAFRAATFQMLFLLLMVPLPQFLLEKATFILRWCSTQTAGAFFRLAGVPTFQDGFRFSLPGIDVEVAEQCSGTRSGVALFITSLLMGHLFLRSPWRKFCLIVAVFPVTILKNGLRIVTISWLAVHPNLDLLTIWLHKHGGIPFSFLGFSVLAFLVMSLRQFDKILWKGHAG
jgi:exosortase